MIKSASAGFPVFVRPASLKKDTACFVSRRTDSPKAKYILDNLREELRRFQMITSKKMNAPLNTMEGN